VLILSIFFLMILALLGSALITLVPTEMLAAGRDRTDTTAHYACLAGIEQATSWITAVQCSSGGVANSPNALGDTWGPPQPNNSYGTTVDTPHPFDPFSVPLGDPNYSCGKTLNDCLTVLNGTGIANYNNFASGMDVIGLKAEVNLSANDTLGLAANATNWPMLYSTSPMTVGPCQVMTFILPDSQTVTSLTSGAITSRRCYLVTSLAFLQGVPIMRCRSTMLESTYAKYAWFVDQNPNSQTFNIVAGQVLANGPFNSNTSPHFAITSANYFNTTTTVAINGVVTFAPDNNTIANINVNENWDSGLAWVGGNWNGANQALDPANLTVGANGAPLILGNLNTAYNEVVAGGKPNIRAITPVALPSELNTLANSAWGSPTTTGLGPYGLQNQTFDNQTTYNPQSGGSYVATYGGYNTVAGGFANSTSLDPNQQKYSSQSPTYTVPAYYNMSGNFYASATYTIPTQGGLFVNLNPTSYTAAGGIALSGNMQAVSFDIADQFGNMTNGAAAGNPVIRVQQNGAVGADTADQIPIPGASDPTFYASGYTNPYSSGYSNPYTSGYTGSVYSAGYANVYLAGYAGAYASGYAGAYGAGYTGGYASGYTGSVYSSGYVGFVASDYTYTYSGYQYEFIPAVSVGWSSYNYSDVIGVTANPTYHPGSPGTFYSGSSGNFYSGNPGTHYTAGSGTFFAAGNGTFYAASTGTYYAAGTVTFYSGGSGTFYGSSEGNPYASGYQYPTSYVYEPRPFQPVDWVVQTNYTPMYVQPQFNMSGGNWATGAGAQGASPTNFNAVNATTVVMYYNGGPANGYTLTSPMYVPTGYAVVFKQDRSDSYQVDAFLVQSPGNLGNVTNAAGVQTPITLNGAIFGTGNLDGVRGTNEGRNTIGNDLNTNARISIGDNLLQFGTGRNAALPGDPGTAPLNATNGLGLVSAEVVLRTEDQVFAAAGKYMEIYASIIAGSNVNNGGLDVSNPKWDAGNTTNTIGSGGSAYKYYTITTANGNNNGAMNASNTYGYNGQPNPNGSAGEPQTNPTYQIYGGLVERVLEDTSYLGRGWAANNNFDAQLAAYPPPFFPSTNTLSPMNFIQESLR
jgi:hypothetical protein